MYEEATATATVMADVEEPRRMVIDGKRMVEKPMSMDKVRRVLAINPKPPIIHPQDVDPLSVTSMKLCQLGFDKIREFQDNIRRDLDTKGYVLGWATDDEEDDETTMSS